MKETAKEAVKKVLGGIFIAVVVYYSFVRALPDIGPTIDAVQGEGTPGVFQVESTRRESKTGACNWTGTFTSERGEVRRGVTYEGDTYCVSAKGERFPARDTGARSTVFGGEKTDFGILIGVLIFSLPALLALLSLVILALEGMRRLFRLRGDRPRREGVRRPRKGGVQVGGRSLQDLREDPRLSAAQRDMIRPRPRTSAPPPGWTPRPPGEPPQEAK